MIHCCTCQRFLVTVSQERAKKHSDSIAITIHEEVTKLHTAPLFDVIYIAAAKRCKSQRQRGGTASWSLIITATEIHSTQFED